MSSTKRIVTIFGASGFIGRQVLRSLSNTRHARDITLRLASRNATAYPASYWNGLAPAIARLEPIRCDISNLDQVSRALHGATDVVNCVGILFESPSKGITFERVQSKGPKIVSEAVSAVGTVANVVHVSAIGANINSSSSYARTKAEGEESVLNLATKNIARVSVLRPSIVFGPEDSFFNRFEQLSRYSPFLPLVGGGLTKYQPIHVEDVATAVVKCIGLDSKENLEGLYELGGKTVLSFKELMELVLQATGRRRLLLPVPYPIANAQGTVFETLHRLIPSIPPMLTRDQVELLKADNVVSPGEKTIFDLDIEPAACTIDTISYICKT